MVDAYDVSPALTFAQEEIRRLETDPKSPYRDESHPEHKETLTKIVGLRAQLVRAGIDPTPINEGDAPQETTSTTEPQETAEPVTDGEVVTFISSLPPAPAGVTYDPNAAREYLPLAKSLGADPGEVREMVAFAVQYEREAVPITAQECAGQLVAELGKDEAKRVIERAQFIVKDLSVNAQAYLGRTGLGNSPRMVKFLAGLGKGCVSAMAEAKAITADRKSPYWDSSHKDHAATVKKVQDLYKKAYAGR